MEWREIPSFPNYLVSDLGLVRHRNSPVVRALSDTGSAMLVSLYDMEHGHMTSRNVGALVLEAFIGSAPSGAECSHLDGDYRDNRPHNVAWETRRKNVARKRQHGTHGVKLSEPDVAAIRARLDNGESQRSIARAFGINQSNVSRIANGKAWQNAEV